MRFFELLRDYPAIGRVQLFFILVILYILFLPLILFRKFIDTLGLVLIYLISYKNHCSNSKEDLSFRFALLRRTSLALTDLDTSSATDMSNMFMLCKNIRKLDLSHFVTGNVKDMSFMFCYCPALLSLDLSSFRTSQVTTMTCMFGGCKSLESLVMPYFNTSSVTTMERMFIGCKKIETVDLSSFDTSKVENMTDWFNGCENLRSIGENTVIDMTSVKTYRGMFYNCAKLQGVQLRNVPTNFNYKRAGLRDDQFVILPPVYHGYPQLQ